MEGNQRLRDERHGTAGPLKVSDHPTRCALTDAFVRAAESFGLPRNADFNGVRQVGVGYLQLAAHAGRRCSAVDAFLRPVLRDPHLTLHTSAVATRLVFDGARATG